MVINGLDSNADRKSESIRLMNLAFRIFRKYDLLVADAPLGKADVWMGVDQQVDAVAPDTVSRVMDRKAHEKMTMRVEINPDISAPLSRGHKSVKRSS